MCVEASSCCVLLCFSVFFTYICGLEPDKRQEKKVSNSRERERERERENKEERERWIEQGRERERERWIEQGREEECQLALKPTQ